MRTLELSLNTNDGLVSRRVLALTAAFNAGDTALATAIGVGDAAVTTAFRAGDAAVTNAFEAGDTTLKTAFEGGDSALRTTFENGYAALRTDFEIGDAEVNYRVGLVEGANINQGILIDRLYARVIDLETRRTEF